MVVTYTVGFFGLFKTIRLWQALLVFLLYPASLGLVAGLEAAGLK